MRHLLLLALATIVLAVLPGWSIADPETSELATAPLPEPAEERFEFYRAVMDGNVAAIRRLKEHCGENSFRHWLLGAAQVRHYQLNEAAQSFRMSLQLGEIRALLALAETHFKARNWIEAYAWAQIWVLEHFSPEQIAGGEAEGDPGLYLLRELLNRLGNRELQRAESLTEQYIRDWLPQLPEPETYCAINDGECSGWQPVHREPPNYPRRMLNRQYQAWVQSIILIGPDGRVDDVEVLFASRDGFEGPTRRALERWTFAPPEDHDGQSGALMTQIIDYELRR